MSKSMKIVTVLLIMFLALFATSTIVFAAPNVNSIVGQLDNSGKNTDTTGITSVGSQIINIVSTVGIVVAVITLLILGIKYMMGSASEKAEYKKTMIPYVVGITLLLGASAIVKALASFKII